MSRSRIAYFLRGLSLVLEQWGTFTLFINDEKVTATYLLCAIADKIENGKPEHEEEIIVEDLF